MVRNGLYLSKDSLGEIKEEELRLVTISQELSLKNHRSYM